MQVANDAILVDLPSSQVYEALLREFIRQGYTDCDDEAASQADREKALRFIDNPNARAWESYREPRATELISEGRTETEFWVGLIFHGCLLNHQENHVGPALQK